MKDFAPAIVQGMAQCKIGTSQAATGSKNWEAEAWGPVILLLLSPSQLPCFFLFALTFDLILHFRFYRHGHIHFHVHACMCVYTYII